MPRPSTPASTLVYPDDGSTTTYSTCNDFAEPSSMTDQLDRTTTYTYNAMGEQTEVTSPSMPFASGSPGWNMIRRRGFTKIMPDTMIRRLEGL
jgi:RHS Repeat